MDPSTPETVVSLMPLSIVLPLLLMAAAAWFAALKLTRRWTGRGRVVGRTALCVVLASLTSGAALEVLNYGVRWASETPVWILAVLAGGGIVLIRELYGHERRVTKPRLAKAILALRVALYLLVLMMLNQPVLRWTRSEKLERHVAVLVDDSASMRNEERLWTPGEMMDVATLMTLKPLPGRPAIQSVRERLASLAWTIREESLRPEAGDEEGDKVAAFKRRAEKLISVLDQWLSDNRPAKPPKRPGSREQAMDQVLTYVDDAVNACRQQYPKLAKGGASHSEALAAMGAAVDNAQSGIVPLQEKIDKDVFDGLDAARRAELVERCRTSRAAVASRLLMDRNRTGVGLVEALDAKYVVDLFMVGDGARRGSPDHWDPPAEFRQRTDLSKAFDQVRQQIPPAQLAGVVLLSDGCDNNESGVDSAARRLGAPVHAVVVGGTRNPCDASLIGLHAPDSVFLGDRIRVLAQVQVTGAAGQTVKVSLRCGDKVVDEVPVAVDSARFQREVRLSHTPDKTGLSHYRVEVSPTTGEYSPDNNARDFDVAISDDRLNVLLVDSYPRWEFKYLRNLFYGRDKSISLQFVLFNPDEIEGQLPRPVVAASASRPYEDAEATALPASPEEWGKFGVIMIGDVGPEALPEADMKAIHDCVANRGALLVVIAGPRNMPSRWSRREWMEMMPLTWTPRPAQAWSPSPEPQFNLRLTSDGRQHMLAALSDDATENDEIWTRLPPMSWRTTFGKVKPGAQLIAFAEPVAQAEKKGEPQPAAGAVAATPADPALEQNALVAIQQFGQGKVMMLGFDQTWRLRYEIGDTYHHRFWGQIVRWGAGERLRAGGEFVRLGSDRVNYAPGATIHLTARVLDHARTMVKGRDIAVSLSSGEKGVARITLVPRQGAYGLFEGSCPAPTTPGSYQLKLEGSTVEQTLAEVRQDPVQTTLTVVPPPLYLEFMKLNADVTLLERVAAITGGSVHRPCLELPETLQFGEGTRVRTQVIEKVVWDTWIWFALVALLATAEWLLRRKGGLV